MELKIAISLLVFTVTAFGVISAPAIIMTDEVFAKKNKHNNENNSNNDNGNKGSKHSNHGKNSGGDKNSGKKCNPHGCKGTHGYYTVKGHHHCFKGSNGCKQNGHYHH